MLAGLALALSAWAQDPLEVLPGHVRLSFDEVVLPQNERMGLLGGNVLFEPVARTYFGLGVYGAITGDRGGFFTGGFETGLRMPLTTMLHLDVGTFVGGGGGGSAPQGGGLMLRPHAGLVVNTAAYGRWGIGVSEVYFPNGNIRSMHAAVSVERTFDGLAAPGWPRDAGISREGGSIAGKRGAEFRRRGFAVQALGYVPPTGQKGRGGRVVDGRLDLIGVRWREYTPRRWYMDFETSGAWGGGIDGYAQVLFGGGYRYNVLPRLALSGGALVGGAGGGNVDTGGGGLYRIYVGVRHGLTPWWALNAETGYTAAPDGGFSALSGSVGVEYVYEALAAARVQTMPAFGEDYRWAHWRVRAANQRYIPYGRAARKYDVHSNLSVDMVGVKTDAFLDARRYLTGQAYGAYRGRAGGYAVGVVGPGYVFSGEGGWLAGAEALVGAAGGGGLAVGGGLIVQPMAQFGYRFNKRFSAIGSYGYLYAPSGTLRAHVVDISVSYAFATLHRAPRPGQGE